MQHRNRKVRRWTPVDTRAAAVWSIIAYREAFERLDAMPPHIRATMLQTITRGITWFSVCRAGVWYAGPSKFVGCDAPAGVQVRVIFMGGKSGR